jgi:quercetin dioxygenase-like cupin family protein
MTDNEANIVRIPGMTVEFLLQGDDTDGRVSAFRCDMAQGSTIPVPHSHDQFDETVYGLRGVLTFTIDGKAHEVGPGDVVFIPRGSVHGFFARNEEEVSILTVTTPALFPIEYFREIGAILEAAGDGPPDKGAIVATMLRYGVTPAVPAMAG